jgi:predicted kinase
MIRFWWGISLAVLSCSIIHCSNSAMQKLCQRIYAQHYPTLKNTTIPHQRLCICFSATPGMGKTYLSHALEDKIEAVRISFDEIAAFVVALKSPFKTDTVMQAYTLYFLQHYTALNKRFVLDGTVDRHHTFLFPFFKHHGIRYTVLRLQAPQELVIARIKEREKGSPIFLTIMSALRREYENFGRTFPHAPVINNGYEDKDTVVGRIVAVLKPYL